MSFDLNLPVWITKDDLSECKERDRLLLKSQKTEREGDKRNRVVNFRNSLKCTYFKSAFAEAGHDQKKLWKIVKQLFGNPK